MRVKDAEELPESIGKMVRILRAVPQMESFVKDVCELVQEETQREQRAVEKDRIIDVLPCVSPRVRWRSRFCDSGRPIGGTI